MATIRSTTLNSSKLTSECWEVQIWGLASCKKCAYKDTPECGGVDIIKTGKNSKGHKVPLMELDKFKD